MTERPLSQRLFRMAIGAAVGAAICGVGAALGIGPWLKSLSGEDLATVALAAMLLFLAVFAVIVSSSQRTYKLMAENYREGDPADAGVLGTLRTGGLILLISGALLLAPVIAMRMGASRDILALVAGALGALTLFQTWLSWRVMQRSDELTKAANSEGSVIAFWVTMIGLYGWAMLTKFDLVGDVSLWMLMIIATAATQIITIGVSMRRGLFA